MGRFTSAAVIALSLAIGVGCLVTSPPGPAPRPEPELPGAPGVGGEKPFRPATVIQGTHSQVAKETFKLVRTSDAWDRVWEEHRGNPGIPQFTEHEQSLSIDFENHLLVAIFTGHCDWCEVTPRLRGDVVVIGFRAVVYQIAGRAFGGGGPEPDKLATERKVAKAPYAFVVLRKPVKRVVIEEDVRREIASPPEWKQREVYPDPESTK